MKWTNPLFSQFPIYDLPEVQNLFYGPCEICSRNCMPYIRYEIENVICVAYHYYRCLDVNCPVNTIPVTEETNFLDIDNLSNDFLDIPANIAEHYHIETPICNVHMRDKFYVTFTYPDGRHRNDTRSGSLYISMYSDCRCGWREYPEEKTHYGLPLDDGHVKNVSFELRITKQYTVDDE